jgi:rhamnose utilization protein RhaD (predicted bifunctional aldolase and dehydrogenase)
MIDSKDINDYIQLSRLIGGYSELVQGSGGNISVKNDTHICIKSSGRILAETDTNYGYSICSIKNLQELFKKKDENTKSAVEDGEPNSVPSMEVFFHLLPHKWIVHIHPTFLLKYLCSEGWKNIHSKYKSICIPYKTPGLELSTYIHENYNGETTIFLQNHGLIVCGNSPREICKILDNIYTENVSIIQNNYQHLHLTNVYDLLGEIQLKTNITPVIKNTYKNPIFYDRLFFSLTPDIVLFLKKYPLVKEDSSENLCHLFDKYYNLHKTIPSILKIQDRVFILGKNFKHCLAIEEIFYSYLEIVSSIRTKDLHTLYDDNVFALQNSEKEVHRMNIL